MRKSLIFPLTCSLLILMASPAFAAKAPSYSSALKIAKRFAPSSSALVEELKNKQVPNNARGFTVWFNSACSAGGAGQQQCVVDGDMRVEVLVARILGVNVVDAAYYAPSAGSGTTQLLFTRMGAASDTTQKSWGFVANDQPLDSQVRRNEIRAQFISAAEAAMADPASPTLRGAVLVGTGPEAVKATTLASTRFFPSGLSSITTSWPGSTTEFGLEIKPRGQGSVIVSRGNNLSLPMICGSKLRLSVTGKLPGAKKSIRKKTSGLQAFCL